MSIRDWFRRSDPQPLDFDEYVSWFQFGGHSYPFGLQQTLKGSEERIGRNFADLITAAYKQDGVVFACEQARLLHFSEARFQLQEMENGRPGRLVDKPNLALLERPWPGGTTGDLLTRMLLSVDFAGDAFVYRQTNTRLRCLRPDWVTIVYGSNSEDEFEAWALDAEVLGYLYHLGGPQAGKEPEVLLPEQVAHFSPFPDLVSPGRGMSWLEPVIQEILGDKAATRHKIEFFRNGATPNLVVSLPETMRLTPEQFDQWRTKFEERHTGVRNAYKTMFLAMAKAEVVGADLKQIDFKATQGAGETRIAAAAGVPPVIVGLSEGLSSATYSNYAQARRRFADGTMRPLWRNASGSLSRILRVPADQRLWYDDRDVSFLQEDLKDQAEVQQRQAGAIEALIRAGFKPESVVDAVTAGDLSRLKASGLVSVQLQKPGMPMGNGQPPPEPAPAVPTKEE